MSLKTKINLWLSPLLLQFPLGSIYFPFSGFPNADIIGFAAIKVENPSLVKPLSYPENKNQKSANTNPEAEAVYFLDQGYFYYEQDDWETAIAYWEQALILYRQTGSSVGEATTLGFIGDAYRHLSNYVIAGEYYENSLRVVRQLNDRETELRLLNSIGNLQYLLENYSLAQDYYENSLRITREVGNQVEEIRILRNLGNLNQQLENYTLARDYYENSLRITRQLGDRAEEAEILNAIGDINFLLGQYLLAQDFYENALSLARELNDYVVETRSLRKIGDLAYLLGNYSVSRDYYEISLRIARQTSDSDEEVKLLNAIGNLNQQLGNLSTAQDFYEQSLRHSRNSNDLIGEVRALYGLGQLNASQQKYPQALENLEASLAIIQTLNLNDIGLDDEFFTGELLGSDLVLEEHYEIRLVVAYNRTDLTDEVAIVNAIGTVYRRQGEYAAAQELYRSSLQIARDRGDRGGEALALKNLGYLFSHQEQFDLAIVFLKPAVNIYERIRQQAYDTEAFPGSDLYRIYLEAVQADYRFLADLLLQRGRFLEALQILELLKTEEIREYTRGTVDNLQTGEIALSLAEQEVIDSLGDLVQLGRTIDDCENEIIACTDGEIEGLHQDLKILTEEYNRLIADLPDEAPPTPRPGDLITEGVAEVLEAQPHTMLIYPVVLSDRLVLLWAVRGGVANAIEVTQVTEADINQAAFEFRRLMRQCETQGCTSDDIPAIQTVAQQLHQWLIPQDLDTALQQQGIENLVFALDQQLRYIPMAALHNGEQYLIERYKLSTVTAAWLTPVANPLPTNPAEVSVLALGLSEGVPDTDPTDDVPSFAPLKFVPFELEAIVGAPEENDRDGVYSGIGLLNDQFDDRAFNRLKVDGYQILHIATHGMFVPTNLYASYLMLGNLQDWRISEIKNIQQQFTDLSLVVLSACETALGGPQQATADAAALDGREISGIAQTFLDAGADAILASLWKVSDASTSALMQQFYLELAKGTEANPVTYASALQQAQVRILTGEVDPEIAATLRSVVEWGDASTTSEGEATAPLPDLSHPFYWAPFILIGNGL